MSTPQESGHPHAPYPSSAIIIQRLREVLGDETVIAPDKIQWRILGERERMDLEITMDPRPCSPPSPQACDGDREPCVIWVTRPDEAKPERCPIVTLQHLESFLALVSIARRSAAPVYKHVCPGED